MMKFLIEKLSLLKSGFAIAAMAIAVTNYSQSSKSYSALTPKIIDARASNEPVNEDVDGGGGHACRISPNHTCTFVTPDGVPHVTLNAEEV